MMFIFFVDAKYLTVCLLHNRYLIHNKHLLTWVEVFIIYCKYSLYIIAEAQAVYREERNTFICLTDIYWVWKGQLLFYKYVTT